MPLEDHYLGDTQWAVFVSVHRQLSTSAPSTNLVLLLLGNEDIAVVVNSIITKEQQHHWLHSKCPALGDIPPLQCLSSPLLTNRLRTCLMRFPA